jgi:hypothetical protein
VGGKAGRYPQPDGNGVNTAGSTRNKERETEVKRERRYEIPIEERETGYVLDYGANVVHAWTYCPAVAREWRRKGYGGFLTIGCAPNGRAVSWKGDFTIDAVRPLATFQDGAVKRRRGHRKGGVSRQRAD